jgi:hypothetical protein
MITKLLHWLSGKDGSRVYYSDRTTIQRKTELEDRERQSDRRLEVLQELEHIVRRDA